MKAIFLDRDGVINDNSTHYYTYRKNDVVFVEGIFENLILLKEKGFEFFVVTNQGGIAKGIYSHEDVIKVHDYIQQEMNKYQININDFIFCPHHDSIESCDCRKPSPAMIEKLIIKYNIDPATSFFIGDSQRDMEAAKAASVTGILVESNQNMKPFIMDLI